MLRPILPRPSARSVPRWRWDWPIWERTCVTLSFGIRRIFLRGLRLCRRLIDRLRDGSRGLEDGFVLGDALCDERHAERARRIRGLGLSRRGFRLGGLGLRLRDIGFRLRNLRLRLRLGLGPVRKHAPDLEAADL